MGWTGKLWALSQGIAAAQASAEPPEYLLLSDADIGYAADSLSRQVAIAIVGGQALVSRMAKLRCENFSERALIPAFIFFFQMLFPFAWVNRADRRTAAGAGGCMLVHRRDLEAAGGVASIRGALIDDCALAGKLKAQGPIRLELSPRVVSLRPYQSLGEIRRMVARSAYAQLRFSPLLLLGTVAGMALLYVAPPALAIFAHGAAVPAGRDHLACHGRLVPAHIALLPAFTLLGPGAAGDRGDVSALHHRFRLAARQGPRWHVEGPRPGAGRWRTMSAGAS